MYILKSRKIRLADVLNLMVKGLVSRRSVYQQNTHTVCRPSKTMTQTHCNSGPIRWDIWLLVHNTVLSYPRRTRSATATEKESSACAQTLDKQRPIPVGLSLRIFVISHPFFMRSRMCMIGTTPSSVLSWPSMVKARLFGRKPSNTSRADEESQRPADRKGRG